MFKNILKTNQYSQLILEKCFEDFTPKTLHLSSHY